MTDRLVRRAMASLFALCLAHAAPCLARVHAPPQLTAGTGMADIDPAPGLLPVHNNPGDPYLATIHDSLMARALVIDQGRERVILVVADLIVLPDDVYDRIVARVAETYHLPRDHVWLTATHCHTVPWSMAGGYESTVSDGVVAAVAQAAGREEPVTAGAGDGKAFININRDELDNGKYILGQNPDGPSDKTVRVAALFRKDGTPLAILPNYAVHAVTLHSSFTAGDGNGFISADIPGVTDRFVDAHYGTAMTLWTSGAAADQNPVLMSFYDEPGADGGHAATDMKTAGWNVTERLGQNLAREIIRVTDAIRPKPVTARLRAADTLVSCPARTDPKALKRLRIAYIGLGPIDLVAVSGEVNTAIDRHLRRANPGRSPLLFTLTNGYGGYLPDDASYRRGQNFRAQTTFEVQKTFFAPGCVEGAIVKAATRLMTKGR